MAQIETETTPLQSGALPGAVIIARIRRVLILALVAGLPYTMFVRGQKSMCTGSGAAEQCAELTLSPSPLVVIGLVAIVIFSIGRVLRTATDEPTAVRILDRAAAGIVVLVGASFVISYAWFALVPVPDPTGPISVVFPFPFASGDLILTP